MLDQILKSNNLTDIPQPCEDGTSCSYTSLLLTDKPGGSKPASLLSSDSTSNWNQGSSIGGGVDLMSDFNGIYARAKNVREVATAHFDEWDQDGNSVLSLTEILIAKENAADSKGVTELSILEKGYNAYSSVNIDNERLSYGISRDDLDLSLTFLEPGRTNYDFPNRIMGSFGVTLGTALLANQAFSMFTRASIASAGMYSIAISRYPTAALAVGAFAGLAAGVGLYLGATDSSRRHLEESRDSLAKLLRSASY